ncbi:hypothetical protein C4D60_Mb11t07270 [Musa balbisiana]|uniref:CASP-like protein n=1 Tax=Musa balbisiana TaxID=52838 RepID=A0A4S8J2D3_MUSBA|nr:hypothetical protein C4D60_Mb11t07270 [Musa balbisiana]
MEKRVMIFCAAAGFLGLLSAALAFAAEATRIKVSDVETTTLAFVLLLSGAALNDRWGQERMYFGEFCYVVKSGVFSGGAVLSLASVALGIVYYISSVSLKNVQPCNSSHNQDIALGHPHTTPQSRTTPVFVHEDTYNRQQFP